ncbi:DUF4870 domain-containing protein [Haladaptatus pallidirubidus]|uniref:DUF4870 domain-containing protein n=1 Tax=Haladaptatus pallidirubidus TaxID=1008152 RepID=A0AAV3UKA8_9EURY|nr:hypothetical protein [Haladaptatus pallidirubidus]
MAVEPKTTTEVTESTSSKTGTGLDENLAGALAYLLSPLTGILFFVLESENEFVKFHSAQSIAFGIGLFLVYVAMTFVQFALLFIPRVGGLFSLMFSLAYFVVGFAAFLGWLFLMYKAYSGDTHHMPVFGNVADRIA